MFSYRHAYHAGNHADVIKHLVLLSSLRYQIKKEAGLLLIDTHAGAGLYRLDESMAQTSGEAKEGFVRLWTEMSFNKEVPDLLAKYLGLVEKIGNKKDSKTVCPLVYPGSPWLMQHFLRPQDSMKLFEIHPTDSRILIKNIEQLKRGKIEILRESGFDAPKKYFPPATNRAIVLIDPSYEIKSDYATVLKSVQDGLKRFLTATYIIWYPIIPRPEAHALPKKLKTLAKNSGRSWLNVTLSIGSVDKKTEGSYGKITSSGVFIINPHHLLQGELETCLPLVVKALKQGSYAGFRVETA